MKILFIFMAVLQFVIFFNGSVSLSIDLLLSLKLHKMLETIVLSINSMVHLYSANQLPAPMGYLHLCTQYMSTDADKYCTICEKRMTNY